MHRQLCDNYDFPTAKKGMIIELKKNWRMRKLKFCDRWIGVMLKEKRKVPCIRYYVPI